MPDEYLPYREATLTAKQRAEYRALYKDWRHADAVANAVTGADFAIAKNAAYRSLCDWVTENGLDWTVYDLRGPELVDPYATPYATPTERTI